MLSSSTTPGRLIIVSNRLPVTVTESNGTLTLSRSAGGLAIALDAVFERADALWIGWTGLNRQLSRQELDSLHFPEGVIPVNLKAEQVARYRERAFNETLCPLFLQRMPPNPCGAEDWQAVAQVMRRFTAVIRRTVKPTDTIWVHDTQLALLPYYLREAGVTNRIGFFFHMPFPPLSYLMELPIAAQLLDSLNRTDVLGFQTKQDAENFEACFRYLHPGKTVLPLVRDFPIGVDFDKYHQAAVLSGVKAQMRAAKAIAAGRKVIFSMSRLDYAKGIVEQLQAVEKFLNAQPARMRKEFVYTLVVAPSREDVAENQRYKRDIERTVERINRRFGSSARHPVQYMYRALNFDEVNAWYRLADVLLVTPPLDGMNLVAKEYVAARHNDNGMLVLSKTIGAALQLNQAVFVDAADVAGIAAGLSRSFAMSRAEREQRWAALRTNVKEEDIFWWAKSFIGALESLNRHMLQPQSHPLAASSLTVEELLASRLHKV